MRSSSVVAPDAAESTVDAQGDPLREQAIVQFYATAGSFDDDVRIASDATTKWRARASDTGERVTLWFVLRDDRGGVSWTVRELQLAASPRP